jgi:hypothetical protein
MNERTNEAYTYKLAFLSCLSKLNAPLLEYGKDITPAFARTSRGMMIGGANKRNIRERGKEIKV